MTVKSDDVVGRVKAYEAIVKGQNIPEPGVPESFKVLIKELQSIGLDIRVLSGDSKEIIIRDDDDEDDRAVRKKAQDMGVDVGNYGDHDVKAPEPEPPLDDDVIAEDVEPEESEFTDDEIDTQLDNLADMNDDAPADTDDNFSDDIADITRYNREEDE